MEEKEVVDKIEQSSKSESIPPFHRRAPCYRKPLKARSFLFKSATMANRMCWASQGQWSNSAMWSSDREGRVPGAIAVSWVLCQQPGQTLVFTISDQGCYNCLESSQLSPRLDRLQPTRGMGHFSTVSGQCTRMQHLLTLASCVCSLFFTSVSSEMRALKARLVLVNCFHIWSDKVSNRCSASSRSRMELARMF